MTWIFPDDAGTPAILDRQALADFLARHDIRAQGHFEEALKDDEGLAWRYPAYAVKQFRTYGKLVEKLRLLCIPRGTNPNDIERNYQNQLVEFHALYALTRLMDYQFVGWDLSAGKSSADLRKNCDLGLMKDSEKIFADAKDCSSEILSQDVVPHEIDERTLHVTHYTPKVELLTWMGGKIKETDKKGADILVCHVPGWGLEGFDESKLKQYSDLILPDILTWTADGPTWSFATKHVKEIVIIKRMGSFVVRLNAK